MNDEQLTRLRNRLARRKEHFEKAHVAFYTPMLHRFHDFLKTNPILMPILDELNTNKKGRLAACDRRAARVSFQRSEP